MRFTLTHFPAALFAYLPIELTKRIGKSANSPECNVW